MNLLQKHLLSQSLCISAKEEDEEQSWRTRRKKTRMRKRKDRWIAPVTTGQ